MSLASSPDDPFQACRNFWNLESLCQDLAEAKGSRLTPTETTLLCGLLLGSSPQEIAQKLHRSKGAVRVELSKIYGYIRILYPLNVVEYGTVARVLEGAYKRYQPLYLMDAGLSHAPGGQLPLTSQYYIERSPEEQRWYAAILRSGALIRIKAPRQMGKTSLMSRILHHAYQNGCRTTFLSFQIFDQEDFRDSATFLQRFCAVVTQMLGLPNRINEFWGNCLGNKMNCRVYFEQYLLPELTQPLVLALDEVDRIFQYSQAAAEFFSLLRAWVEEGQIREPWKNLRLIVAHSTEAYLQLDSHQSPFNLGETANLTDFRPEQVWDLAQRYGQVWTSEQIEYLWNLVRGHPFLLQSALYRISIQDITLEELIRTAATETSIYQEHLHRYLGFLNQNIVLKQAMIQVIESSAPIRLETFLGHKLFSLGLIRFVGNDVTVRCELYRQYFRDRLI